MVRVKPFLTFDVAGASVPGEGPGGVRNPQSHTGRFPHPPNRLRQLHQGKTFISRPQATN